MILLGAGVALLGSEFVCFQVHTGAFPPGLLLAVRPLSHASCFVLAWPGHPSRSGSSCPNVISPGYVPALWCMCNSLIWGSKACMYLMSPILYHHHSRCEPCRVARTGHLHWKESDNWSKPSLQQASSFWVDGVEGARGHTSQRGAGKGEKKVPEKDGSIGEVTIATLAGRNGLFLQAMLQRYSEILQGTAKTPWKMFPTWNVQWSPIMGFALAGNF